VPASLERAPDIDPDERAVARPQQKSVVNQFGKDRIAKGGFERPQPARLWLGQAQPGHFQEFPSNTANDVIAKTCVGSLHIASSVNHRLAKYRSAVRKMIRKISTRVRQDVTIIRLRRAATDDLLDRP
jgi:hypothetical protein